MLLSDLASLQRQRYKSNGFSICTCSWTDCEGLEEIRVVWVTSLMVVWLDLPVSRLPELVRFSLTRYAEALFLRRRFRSVIGWSAPVGCK